MQQVRVRFAPSPTGHLHVGGARQAIFNWLFAKANGGKFLLRIEDTDRERSKDEYTRSIVSAMQWLGLTIDEEIMIQSHNIDYHNKVAHDLIEQGRAYKCYCSIDELALLRESSSAVAFKYPGTCRSLTQVDHQQKAGQPYVIRFLLPKMPRHLDFKDLIKGDVSIESTILDDFVIIKSDLVSTYNFAVVLDDLKMQITHVLRGEDHIINTFRQILLYQALNEAIPLFGHASMILGPNGERLSKRHGATSVIDYKKMGILPEALFNYLVRLGWSHGDQEVFSREELIKIFSIDGIGTKNGIFDIAKLNWLNTVYLKALQPAAFLEMLSQIDPESANFFNASFSASIKTTVFSKLLELYKPRSTTLLDLAQQLKTCISTHNNPEVNFVRSLSPDVSSLLKDFIQKAVVMPLFSAENLQNLSKQLVLLHGKKLPDLAKPLRYILSGYFEGASTFELCEIFGAEHLKTIFNLFYN